MKKSMVDIISQKLEVKEREAAGEASSGGVETSSLG